MPEVNSNGTFKSLNLHFEASFLAAVQNIFVAMSKRWFSKCKKPKYRSVFPLRWNMVGLPATRFRDKEDVSSKQVLFAEPLFWGRWSSPPGWKFPEMKNTGCDSKIIAARMIYLLITMGGSLQALIRKSILNYSEICVSKFQKILNSLLCKCIWWITLIDRIQLWL